VKALAFMAEEMDVKPRILTSVMETNNERRKLVINRLKDLLGELEGHTIGLLGLAFKPNTDDMRDAPSVDIANALLDAGAQVRGYDPVSMKVAEPLIPRVKMMPDPYVLAEGCDALIVNTEWNEFTNLDLKRIRDSMRQPIIFDGRNIYDPEMMGNLNFIYRGMGRGYDSRNTNNSGKSHAT
jgi:UDPglucose 6-dehydrogenase